MIKYAVEIVPKAEKEYLKLPNAVRLLMRKKILALEDNPRPFGSTKLKESEYHRFRVGDYRVIYSIIDNKKTVKILSIGHRREVYR